MEFSTQLLRQAGLKVTPARIALLKLLFRAKQAMSVENMHRRLVTQGIDRVTVYRNAETLAKAGIVRTVDFGHSHAHYELNNQQAHHHHLVCQSCGKVQDVRVKDEARIIQQLEDHYHFTAQSHSFELFGLCAKCRA